MTREDVLKFIEGKEGEFVIHTEAEYKELIANVEKDYDEKVVPDKLAEIQNKYDEDVFAITGIRRTKPERTHDFVKRTLTEYYQKATGADVLANENSVLKKKIADGITDEKMAADLKKVQEDYAALQAQSEEKVKKINSEFDGYRIKAEIMSSMSGMVFNERIPEEALTALKDSTVNDLALKAEYRDGVLVFLDAEGNPMRNKNNVLKPFTAAELLKERLKGVLKTKDGKGPELSDEIHKEYDDSKKLSKVLLVIPDSVKTKMKLGEFLVEKGLLRGTPEYDLAYKEYSSDLPLK